MLLMAGYIYHIIEGKQEVPPVKIKKKCIQTINAVHVLLKETVIVFIVFYIKIDTIPWTIYPDDMVLSVFGIILSLI